jgi:hypothetical protein
MTRGKEKMNEVGRMVRVKMADKDMFDFMMIDPNTGKLVQSPWPHIKEHKPLIQEQCQ